MDKILKELCEFLNNSRLHLVDGDATMCELDGIGAIYIPEYELRDEVFAFLKSKQINVFMDDAKKYREIRFYTDLYKDEIENTLIPPGEAWEMWTPEELRNRNWEIISGKTINEWLAKKYQVKSFKNDYWYHLKPNGVNSVITQKFLTKGSKILGTRRVEMDKSIRNLEDYELCGGATVPH